MGSNDTPPAHVASSYRTISTLLLGGGGAFYTLTYILMIRQSLRDRTYAMPLFTLAFNIGWETVFALYVAESLPEKTIFVVWLLIDQGLIYTVLKYGENEWAHAPVVARNIGGILCGCVAWWCWALWAFCRWWITQDVNPKAGKWYMGVEGRDTTELGFWTALVAQVVLSGGLLAQILVRGNSGGASYSIWTARFVGSMSGLNAYYGYCWYAWPEAHAYFLNPFAVCLSITWVLADVAYVYVLYSVKQTEIVLQNGRKLSGRNWRAAGKAA